MALALLDLGRGIEANTHRGCNRSRVDHGEPAERDDAEQELCRLTRFGIVQAELGADRGERLLAGRDVADAVRTGREEVEVIGDGTGEDRFRALIARQSPGSARSYRLTHLGEGAVQDGLIELGFGAEEIAGGA